MLDKLTAWHNGEYKPLGDVRISPLDFGFIHSDATYDVMRVNERKILFWQYHVERYHKACHYYGFDQIDYEDILEISSNLIIKNNLKNAFIWICNWRGTPESGSPRDICNAPQHQLIYVKPYYPINDNKPISLISWYKNKRSDFAYPQIYKNFAWIEFTRAQLDVQQKAQVDSAVLLSPEGYITEGPGFGVCFVKGNKVITPKRNVLKSVTIDIVENLCKDLNGEFERKDITLEEAHLADECFICSTSGGITPVNKFDHVWLKHKLTIILMREFAEFIKGGYKQAHGYYHLIEER
tara:strand:- start:291 stop:1175 length:885 start_codon:yes stop_codon:yes gene_type:complete